MHYKPNPDQACFLLFDVLQISRQFQAITEFNEVDAPLVRQVLDEAGKFAGDVVAPLNRQGDEIGCHFENGKVTMPPGFRDAYQSFWQAGWPALACPAEDGGQGLPWVLEGILYEWLSAANHGWTMAPGLLHGAYECIRHHGSEDLRSRYLAKLASGEWLATMCLTEPQAGSDLGLIRTRAIAQPDGAFGLSGTKCFISGGEHDLSDNIIHLVLARLPDAPPGPRGLSLFLAPKMLPGGTPNSVFCERIEEKMGLHGSPTCVMRFDDTKGWLVGEPGRGLNAMFVMMNSARLHVALQGIGLLDAAWQKADAYAHERRQMRAPVRADTTQPADRIIEHPAVRRMLDTQRAWVLGGRLLAYQTGIELDLARLHPDSDRRLAAERWCSLLTPVLKAAWTEQAFHGASECLQVFGGHGYVREWGIEQHVRDSRIAMIYEGTNEIQAIDFLIRKVIADDGAALAALLQGLASAMDPLKAGDARALELFATLSSLGKTLARAASSKPELPYWVAGDFLKAMALAMMAWTFTRLSASQAGAGPGAALAAPLQAFSSWILPEFEMRAGIIRAALEPVTQAASQGT